MNKEDPKFTRDKNKIWSKWMNIYLKGMEPQFKGAIETKYVVLVETFSTNQIKVKQENMKELEKIVSTLCNIKYIDIHEFKDKFLMKRNKLEI